MRPIDHHRRFLMAGRVFAVACRLVARLDLPDEVSLPTDRPVLFAGNHRSLFDLPVTMATFAKFELSTRVLIRDDFMRGGPGAAFFRGIGCIPTSSSLRERSEADAVRALLDGDLVSVMPEGRLVPPEEWVRGVGPGRAGVSRIARAANAVVVPVGFSGTEQVWPRDGRLRVGRTRPTVSIRLGPPIELTVDDHEANAALVMSRIADLVEAAPPPS